MEANPARGPTNLLRSVTVPMAVLVSLVVALAWYVTWSTSDWTLTLAKPTITAAGATALGAFLAILVVMMVAMMLPSALPMILAYRGLTRLESGKPVKPADNLGTLLFILPYFLVWGAFSILALLGLVALGLTGGTMTLARGYALAAAGIVLAAGAYQFTRPKDTCLTECASPMQFVMRHWRSGHPGALRMGARHAMYCIGCCWLFMLVLFVAGAMSLLWMGIISLVIFAEKVGSNRVSVSRIIGGLLLVFGAALLAQNFLAV